MKNIIFIIVTILFHTNSFAKILDQAIVIIENDVITQSEFEKKLGFIISQYTVSGNSLPRDRSAMHEQVLDKMINTRLQLNYAEKMGLEFKEWMVDKSMENIAKNSGITLSEFRNKMIEQGIDYNLYRNEVKENLITREIQRRIVADRVKISKKEIDDFIKHKSHIFKENNQYKISSILISVPETPSADEKLSAKNKIKMIQKKFIDGEKFFNLAQNYSDSGNALSGGSLGWRKISEVPAIFLKEMEGLEKESISGIIETINGFYIFYLEDKKEIANTEIEERKVRHILIKTNAIISDEMAQDKILALKIRIENGESFPELARSHSDDTMSAASGGELEWSGPGSFVPEFEDKIDTLPLNKISKPFFTQFGWHILEVLGKRNQDNSDIVMKNMARKFLTSSRADEVIDSWIIELKDDNYIKYISENRDQLNNYVTENEKIDTQKDWSPFSE
jgi:peptidyl-prolyl cis-trans isomerase SurA